MDITLEQARVFESVARLGTLQKAAFELNKGHSAVLYALKTLEEQTGLKVLDRSGYRNALTVEGEIVLKYCRQLLGVKLELEEVCKNIKSGWEPSLKIIYDGIIDFNFLGEALYRLNEMKAPTEVKVLAAHLHEVEALFLKENANIMVTILPLQSLQIPSLRLRPIKMHLVAHQHHVLGQSRCGLFTHSDLNRHTFIRVRTGKGQIGLSTEKLNFESYFYVNDFITKKSAILKKLGFGWLPDYLVEGDLKKGHLKVLKTEFENTHTLHPHLYHKPEEVSGLATRELLRFFQN